MRVTPRSPGAGIGPLVTDADGRPMLAVRVTAPPAEGEANEALRTLLADQLDVAKRSVRLIAGQGARIKRLAVEGDPVRLVAHLEALVRSGSPEAPPLHSDRKPDRRRGN